MPIYEYLCKDCGEQFESIRTMNEADAPIDCNKCHSANTTRMLSVFFATSGGKTVAGTSSPSCAGCVGGSCATCGH